jgi:hypothetical protein
MSDLYFLCYIFLRKSNDNNKQQTFVLRYLFVSVTHKIDLIFYLHFFIIIFELNALFHLTQYYIKSIDN